MSKSRLEAFRTILSVDHVKKNYFEQKAQLF